MKIVVLALASAAVLVLACPALAQQNVNRDDPDWMGPSQRGAGPQHQFKSEDERSGTTGRGGEWSDRDGWRDRNARDDRDGGRMHRWSMRGNMEGRMGPMMRMHERMAHESEAAHFRFRRGQAAIDVQCPQGEPLQACVNAAGQLLDKIATLRDRNAQGTTTGSGGRSEDEAASTKPGGALSNRPLERSSVTGEESEQ